MWLSKHAGNIVRNYDEVSLAYHKICLNWGNISGASLKNFALPSKFTSKNNQLPGVLTLSVSHPCYKVELQMKSQNILERINTYFGKTVVLEIKMSNNPQELTTQISYGSYGSKKVYNTDPVFIKEISAITKNHTNNDISSLLIKISNHLTSS